MHKKMNIGSVILFGLAACVLYGIGAGLRADIGILVQPVMNQTELTYGEVSLCIALMQLVFGVSQPIFGLVAARKSNRFVLVLGAALIISGLLGIRMAHGFVPLLFSLSALFGSGAGAVAFGLVFTSAVYFAGQENAMLISGMLNAAAGMVGFVLSPLLNRLLATGGLTFALMVISLLAAAMIPISFVVTSRDPESSVKGERIERLKPGRLFREAGRSRVYRLLIAGFSTCGFHMIIIESHLFSQFRSYGIPSNAASWAFSLYGIATITGALLSGFLSGRISKGRLLAFYYGFRAVWAALYLFLLPKNIVTSFIFTVGLGMTGDATVSPTSGLVNQEFSIEKVATLVGFLFLCHQIGGFLSAWLGGILVEATGGYKTIWMIDIMLCLFAAIESSRIEKVGQKQGNIQMKGLKI